MTSKFAFPTALIALAVAIGTFLYTSKNAKLVYVDVNQIMQAYKRTPIERAKFDEKAKGLQSRVDSLLSGWQKDLKAYEKERSKMSKKEIELKQELLATKQQQISSYQQAVQKQLAEEDRKSTQTVINDINDFVKEYGKTHNYDIIFGAVGNGNIMYAKEATNLTPKLIELLNKDFDGK